jgi:uncharacterized membrane protein YfcA
MLSASSQLTPQHLWLYCAAFIAGTLNAVAGGGSFVSFPAVLGLGVLPIPANATNTVALWPGQLTSIAGYSDDLRVNRSLLVPVISASLAGGLAGAIILLHTAQGTFLKLVPWLLLVAALLFAASGPIAKRIAARSARRQAAHPDEAPHRDRLSFLPLWLGIAFVCIYIGYFGAGSGFLIMSVLAIFGIDNVRHINALKVVSTTMANGIAVVTFIIGRQVIWRDCLVMMIVAAIGGYTGARYSRKLNPAYMRIFIVLIGLGMSAYFFWKQS